MNRSQIGSRRESSEIIASSPHRKKRSLFYEKPKANDAEPYVAETFIATSKAISSFVPNTLLDILVDNLAAQKVEALRPFSTNFWGICLLADISDFTRLSGVFCARGKDGLDDLQKATSGYMGSLVNTIYSYGGDVIKFAGDALVCVFKPEHATPESYQKSCAYALQCAWVLKDISTPELSLHVGISCGNICVGQLGGFENKWECLISGSCLSDLSICLNDAPRKQVAITREVYECLTVIPNRYLSIDADQLFSKNYLIESVRIILPFRISPITSTLSNYSEDSTLLSQTACYVPRPVTQALMGGSFNFLAELREVTTVFVKLNGYDHIQHENLMSLQKYFYACQDILSESGGFLRQFLIDDKGCVLIALWGVPTATFHDDCRRALGATVRIRSKLLDMKMQCSCGITSGIVYCGTVGNELRREYAAVGEVVNLAARLMSKANGEILLDEKTYSRLPEAIHRKLNKRPLMMVKGKDKPIVTYQFDATITVQEDGRLGATLVDSAIDEELPIRQICKEAFLGPLNNLTSSSGTNQLQFLILEGRLGTGREEATIWLKRYCNAKRLRVISIRLSKADASKEYKALAKIFRHLIREENFDDIDRQTFVINTLLRQMYPRDAETREKVAYPTMRHALGVSCLLSSGNKRSVSTSNNATGNINMNMINNNYNNYNDNNNNNNNNNYSNQSLNNSLGSRNFDSLFEGSNFTNTTTTSQKIRKDSIDFNFVEKYEAKIPTRHINTTLKDIFLNLFLEQPVVIIIEDSHDLDESSWKILLSFIKMQVKVFVVLTQEPIQYLMTLFTAAGSDSSIGELINPESSIYYDWIDTYMNKLTNDKKSSYILLPEFSFSEVRTYLKGILKVGVKDLPVGLDQIVFNLSGGNPYWFQEISSFLTIYGVNEFLSNLGGGTESKTLIDNMNRKTSTSSQYSPNKNNKSFYEYITDQKSFFLSTISSSTKPPRPSSCTKTKLDNNDNNDHNFNYNNYNNNDFMFKSNGNYTVNSIGASEIGEINDNRSNGLNSSGTNSQHSMKSTSPKVTRGSSSKVYNILGNMKSVAKLEFLVVCRFAKLSMDEQRIARTASIIGTTFTADVLNNALPKQLRPYMTIILHSLVDTHWLNAVSEQNSNGMITVEYSFSHPLLHKTLYDLTPSSVKSKIHLSIAKYIEKIYFEDKLYFMSLGYHYSRSGDDSGKTYEYLTRAAFELIASDHGNLDEGITLIQAAAGNVGSATDASALLGVVTKGLQRLRAERIRNESSSLGRRKNTRRETLKSHANLLDSIYSPVEARIRKTRLAELETSLEVMKSKFEKEDNDKIEIEKEFKKQEAYTRSTLNDSINNRNNNNNYDSDDSNNNNNRNNYDNVLNASSDTDMSNEKYIFNGRYVNIQLENSFALTESLSGIQTPTMINSESEKINNNSDHNNRYNSNDINISNHDIDNNNNSNNDNNSNSDNNASSMPSNFIVTNFRYEKNDQDDDDDYHFSNHYSNRSVKQNNGLLLSKFDRSHKSDTVSRDNTSNNSSRKLTSVVEASSSADDRNDNISKNKNKKRNSNNSNYIRRRSSNNTDSETVLKDFNYYDDDDDLIAKMAKRSENDISYNNEFWQIPFIKIRDTYVLQRAIEYNKNNSTRTCDEKVDGLQGKLLTRHNSRVLNSPHQKSQQQLLLKLNNNGHIVDETNCSKFQSAFCIIS